MSQYVAALALGKPIIDVKFVFDSLESMEWKNVLDYEISSLPSKLSRTQHLQEGTLTTIQSRSDVHMV